MKTRQQIIDEYINRQKKPQYREIGIVDGYSKNTWRFSNVTNFVEIHDKDGNHLEFDCKHHDVKGNEIKEHITMNGRIIRKCEIID